MRRLVLLLIAPLLALDSLANCVTGGSIRSTWSAAAWHARAHKHWGWTHRMIDALPFFKRGHCEGAAKREARHGSVWAAWLHDFKAAA
jgi:hypothetical protein